MKKALIIALAISMAVGCTKLGYDQEYQKPKEEVQKDTTKRSRDKRIDIVHLGPAIIYG